MTNRENGYKFHVGDKVRLAHGDQPFIVTKRLVGSDNRKHYELLLDDCEAETVQFPQEFIDNICYKNPAND